MSQTQVIVPEIESTPTSQATALSRLRKVGVAIRRDPRWLCGGVLLLMVLAAIFAPVIAPYDPLKYNPSIASQPPSLAHIFGTDDSGRDQLSRVIYGIRISLSIGVMSIALGVMIGAVLGMIAGFSGGWLDQIVTIVTDSLLAFPSLILALALVAVLGGSILNLVIALAVVRIPIYIRLARGQTLYIRNQEFVTAANSVGTRRYKILMRHVAPNIVSPLLVQATISISLAILEESVLSFLGLGTQPPTPEWGTMISQAEPYLIGGDPWMLLGPSLAIIVTVLCFNLLGDAARDYLDPRSAD